MAQGPFLIDQLQIEPGSAGTRLLSRDAGTGGLKFTDPVVGALLLSQLAGLRAVPNVFVVGKSGAGAQYTTIQSALDDVPPSASATSPYLVLVLPGRYDETISIVRDGVRLMGLGQPEIRSALEATPNAPGATHTVNIFSDLGTTPKTVIIENFIISNIHTSKAAVRVTGSVGTLLGNGGVLLRNCSVQANAAAGNYSLWANTCNTIRIEGGNWQEANNLGLLLLREVSLFQAVGVAGLGALDLRYDTGEDQPVNAAIGFFFGQCPNIATVTAFGTPVAVTCSGAGYLEFSGCSVSDLTFNGDRPLSALGTAFQALTLLGTVQATLVGGAHEATNVNVLAVLDEHQRKGGASFGAELTKAVTFDIPFSDGNYQVSFEVDSQPVNDETPWVTGKAGTGFTLNFATAQTLTVAWLATRTDV